MKGSELLATLPAGIGKVCPEGLERDLLLVDFIKNHGAQVDWFELEVVRGNTSASFLVTNALRVGEPGDSVRVSMSHRGAQQVADMLNAVLPTKALADQTYLQAQVKLVPAPRLITSTTPAMLLQSKKIDTLVALQTADPRVLTGNEGKTWLNHSSLFGPDGKPAPNQHTLQPNAVNYGWFGKPGSLFKHKTTVAGLNAIQPAATAHDYFHVDYSQYVYLVARPVHFKLAPDAVAGYLAAGIATGDSLDDYTGGPCTLPDGTAGQILAVDIYEAHKDPELRRLFTEGDEALPDMRHPAVPWTARAVTTQPVWPAPPRGEVPPSASGPIA